MTGRYAVIGCKLKQNANDGCNSCATVSCFIACFILLVIAPLVLYCVQVNVDGKLLEVTAHYDAQVGVTGDQVTQHELRKKFILPEDIEVDDVAYNLRPDGVLRVEIFLKDTEQPHYRCSVTTEDVTGQVKGLSAD